MRRHVAGWGVVGCIAIQLLATGCGGGGGGLSSLFGGEGGLFGLFGGGDSATSASEALGAIASGGSDGSGDGLITVASDVATVHNPEPASVALFGGGLAGLSLLRRRNARKSKS